MQVTIFTANCIGQAANCSYPNKVTVVTPEQLREAVKADHVCAEYKGNYRGIGNFIRSDVIVMDIDNDHSEEPTEWITDEKLEEIFPDMEYMLASSRHHLLPKEGKSARPRYHIYFPISEITDAEVYGNLKKALKKEYPFFDGNALDAARFIFGADCEEVLVHDGWMTIDEEIDVSQFVEEEDFDAEDSESASGGQIPEGSRNNTMSRFAGRVLKRYGITKKAYEAFLEHAKKCDPPLPESELKTIWNSAVKFFKKSIVNQEGYVPPDEYNADFESASLKPEDYSDIGQAKVLVREYGNELKYTSATDFLRFDGECWREDKQMAIGAVEEFLDLQLQDAMDEVARVEKALEDAGVPKESIQAGPKELLKEVDGKLVPLVYMLMGAQTYLKFVQKRRDYKYIVSAANTAKPMIAISVSDLDKNENLINTPYATYDLRKGLAGKQPHNPEDLITKITACSPGEEGKQIWLDALNLFFCKDQKLIDYVQETVGMAAIGKVYQEHMIIAYGGGANGKSTFWNTIFRVLGNYAGKLSAEALTMNCKRNVKPEMAELKGKRLIISSEMEEGMRLNTAVVKQLWNSKRFKAFMKVRPKVKRVIGLTGTPSSNGLMDLFAEFKCLDMGERLGRFISQYRVNYFVPDRMNGPIVYSYKLRNGAEEQIYKKISDITISMKALDHLQMPELISNEYSVYMSEDEVKIYADMEEDLFIPLKNGEITAANAAALSGKLLQMANGAVYSDDGNEIVIHDQKLDALEDMIEAANGRPVMVAYWFKHDLSRIMRRLTERKISFEKLDSEESIRKWNRGELPVALIHPASAGHGLNLQSGGNMLIWFGLTWSLELYQQTVARLWRQGQTAETVVVQHIVTAGTIDEDVMKALASKDTTQNRLMAAVKARVTHDR